MPLSNTLDISTKLPARTAIINGNFDIWQRGQSFSFNMNGPHEFTADRWSYTQGNISLADAFMNVDLDTDVPDVSDGAAFSNYSLKVTAAGVDSTTQEQKWAIISHVIEGTYLRPFTNIGGTLSFWAKSSRTGTYCVGVRNGVRDHSFVFEYTISQANTWEKYSCYVPLDLGTIGGTWDLSNGMGLFLTWTLSAGSWFNATAPETWESANKICTSNQVDFYTSGLGATFNLSQVQFEPGNYPTPFEERFIGDILKQCQRYYEDIGITHDVAAATSTSRLWLDVKYKTRKRTIPTIYNTGQLQYWDPAWRVPATIVFDPGTHGVRLYMNKNAAGPAFGTQKMYLAAIGLHADAELY